MCLNLVFIRSKIGYLGGWTLHLFPYTNAQLRITFVGNSVVILWIKTLSW